MAQDAPLPRPRADGIAFFVAIAIAALQLAVSVLPATYVSFLASLGR